MSDLIGDSHDDMRTIHHRDVRTETLSRYARVVTCLISFIVGCYRGSGSKYTMRLTQDQSDACRALLRYLRKDETCHSGPATELNYGAEDSNLEDPLEDSDDETYDDAHSFFDDDSQISAVAHKISDNPIQTCLLNLLLSLYTHLPTGQDGKFYSPILRFIVLYSIKKNGKWLNANQITQIFAALLFCGRLLMMVLMHRHVVKHPGIRYSAYVIFINADRTSIYFSSVHMKLSLPILMMTAKAQSLPCTS
jgi:hypothetical protein